MFDHRTQFFVRFVSSCDLSGRQVNLPGLKFVSGDSLPNSENTYSTHIAVTA